MLDDRTELRLIGFPGCPFFQRAAIVLLEKRLAFESQLVDRVSPPTWLGALSPRALTPVLLLDGQAVFDSTAICELLEDLWPEPALLPGESWSRARERGWWAFAGEQTYRLLRTLLSAPDDDDARAELDRRMTVLEAELSTRDWLSGDGTRFGMADVAFAPAAKRIPLYEELGVWSLPSGLPAVRAWSERLRARESGARSLSPAAVESMRRFANLRRAS
jgi:glutathione S-transferase